ncbi:MAG TPA: hypothetical protein VMS18_05815 [Candidatus Binatia bacterium]|nr:hypothetical protein [Candidatus Binatia bacterium]
MFETNDLIEKTQWQKYALCFAAGCLVTTLISYVFVTPVVKRAAARSAEKAALQKLTAELEKNPVQAQLESTKADLQTAAQERDVCKARFDRQTILYDNSIAVDPQKIWIIPADVEPIVVGEHDVTYTHYDLKAKTETARFHPKRQ